MNPFKQKIPPVLTDSVDIQLKDFELAVINAVQFDEYELLLPLTIQYLKKRVQYYEGKWWTFLENGGRVLSPSRGEEVVRVLVDDLIEKARTTALAPTEGIDRMERYHISDLRDAFSVFRPHHLCRIAYDALAINS